MNKSRSKRLSVFTGLLAVSALLGASESAWSQGGQREGYVPLRTSPSPMRSETKPWTRNWVAVSCANTDSSVVLVNYAAGPAGRTIQAGAGRTRTRGATARAIVPTRSLRSGCPRDGIQMDEDAAVLYARRLDDCLRNEVLRDRNWAPGEQIFSEAIYPTALRTVNNDYSTSHPVTDILSEADGSCSLHGSGRAVDLFRIRVGMKTYDYEKAWNRGNPTEEWNEFWQPLGQCMQSPFWVITADSDSKHFNHMHLGLAWDLDGEDFEEWMLKFARG